MRLCRFYIPGHEPHLGAVDADTIYDLTATGLPHFAGLTALLKKSTEAPLGPLLQEANMVSLPKYPYQQLDRMPAVDAPYLLPPVDRQEVWAAGVTYAWSREARVREAQTKDVYVRVYEAERPELFFKSLGEKAVGPNDWIGLRGDSHWNVPEPELALVLNPAMQIVGYTVGNDVSSRDIEGENPLYLPQAKVYRHACALGPVITLANEQIEAQNLVIRSTIWRKGAPIFQAETNTANMRRSLDELAGYLARYNDFPFGAILLTGTGIVPQDDFTLQDGDEVALEIEGIGILRNLVRQM